MSHFVMARRNWPGTFCRTVYREELDAVGKSVRVPLRRVEFPPGEPVELTAQEYAGVQADIGLSLVDVVYDERHKVRSAEDYPPASVTEPEPEPDAPSDSPPPEEPPEAAGRRGRKG